MGMPVGASHGFSAPVSAPVKAAAPPPPPPVTTPPPALNTDGHRGTKVNAHA